MTRGHSTPTHHRSVYADPRSCGICAERAARQREEQRRLRSAVRAAQFEARLQTKRERQERFDASWVGRNPNLRAIEMFLRWLVATPVMAAIAGVVSMFVLDFIGGLLGFEDPDNYNYEPTWAIFWAVFVAVEIIAAGVGVSKALRVIRTRLRARRHKADASSI